MELSVEVSWLKLLLENKSLPNYEGWSKRFYLDLGSEAWQTPKFARRNIYMYIYHTQKYSLPPKQTKPLDLLCSSDNMELGLLRKQKYSCIGYIIIYFISYFPWQPIHSQKALASFSIMTASINDLLHNLNKPRNIYLCVKFLRRVSFLDTLMKTGTTYFFRKKVLHFFQKNA